MSSRYEHRIGPAEAGKGIGLALESFAEKYKLAQERQKMQKNNQFMMATLPEILKATTKEEFAMKLGTIISTAQNSGITNIPDILKGMEPIYQNLLSNREVLANEAKLRAEGAGEAAAKLQGEESTSARNLNQERLKNERLFPVITNEGVINPFDPVTGDPNPRYKVELDKQKVNWEIVSNPEKFDADDVTRAGAALGIPDITPYRSALDVKLAKGNQKQDLKTPVVITNPDGTLTNTTWYLADLLFKAKIAEIKQAKDNYEPQDYVDGLIEELSAIQEGMASTEPNLVPIDNKTEPNLVPIDNKTDGEKWLIEHGFGKK